MTSSASLLSNLVPCSDSPTFQLNSKKLHIFSKLTSGCSNTIFIDSMPNSEPWVVWWILCYSSKILEALRCHFKTSIFHPSQKIKKYYLCSEKDIIDCMTFINLRKNRTLSPSPPPFFPSCPRIYVGWRFRVNAALGECRDVDRKNFREGQFFFQFFNMKKV